MRASCGRCIDGVSHVQLGFCAESKELETWLMHCHDRLKREHSLPSRQDAAWLHEFDRIEQVIAAETFCRLEIPYILCNRATASCAA